MYSATDVKHAGISTLECFKLCTLPEVDVTQNWFETFPNYVQTDNVDDILR